MIKPDSVSLLDIFTDSLRIMVPNYQRNFTWGRNEAQELIEDIKTKSADSDFNFFLGTIIFDISQSSNRHMFVIDGQQRLTTASLLLIACRQAAKLKNSQLAYSLQEKISFKDLYTGKSEDQRMVVSPSIKEIYDHISDETWSGHFPDRIGRKTVKRQVNKIRPLYEYFYSEVKDLDGTKLENFIRSFLDAYFIRIDIKDTTQAFDIFERMNARGIPLDIADLLKNHLFAKIDTDKIEEQWVNIIDNSGTTPLRMLKYFWVSKDGYVRKSELYKRIKDYSIKNGAEKLVNELEDFSYYYWVVRQGELTDIKEYLKDKDLTDITSNESYIGRFFDAIEALRLFRITQIYPVLFSAIMSYQKSKKRSPQDLLTLLEVFEKYHFINNVICERVGNEVEKLYIDYAVGFNSEKFKPIATNLKNDLLKKLAKKEEFISNFATISYATDSIALICYIYDRINNNLVKARGGQRVKLFNSDPSIQKKNFNIEHFLSQKNKKTRDIDKETLEAIDGIGNLLVISRHTNSDLGSLTPSEKIELFKAKPEYTNNLPYLSTFISECGSKTSEWGKEMISKRAESLAKLAYEKIWKF